MIYLTTGLPGTGKTLRMVSMLKKRKDLQNRPLYVDGINGLDPVKIPHEALPEGCDGSNWQEWLPPNAILVIDECQRYWRPRANGSKVPESVKAMELNRHKGVDLFLLTQHPRLLDINVKSFVENHVHLSKTQLGSRRAWEWQRAGNPECLRVLVPGGVLIFKWCEVQIPTAEILKLCPIRPLFGHKSGRRSDTHWVCFIKAD